MSVQDAIDRAETILPGVPQADGEEDPRWQAIIAIGDYVETNPDEVWGFVERWGAHECEDLRSAIATCLLEHLLEHHFDRVFPRVEKVARSNRMFANTVSMCWTFGQSKLAVNTARLQQLVGETAK